MKEKLLKKNGNTYKMNNKKRYLEFLRYLHADTADTLDPPLLVTTHKCDEIVELMSASYSSDKILTIGLPGYLSFLLFIRYSLIIHHPYLKDIIVNNSIVLQFIFHTVQLFLTVI